jgi:hypothetical protein
MNSSTFIPEESLKAAKNVLLDYKEYSSTQFRNALSVVLAAETQLELDEILNILFMSKAVFKNAKTEFLPPGKTINLKYSPSLKKNYSEKEQKSFARKERELLDSGQGKIYHSEMTLIEEIKFLSQFEADAKKGKFPTTVKLQKALEIYLDHEVPYATFIRFLKRHNWHKVKIEDRHAPKDWNIVRRMRRYWMPAKMKK